jgi:hypothetical protein
MVRRVPWEGEERLKGIAAELTRQEGAGFGTAEPAGSIGPGGLETAIPSRHGVSPHGAILPADGPKAQYFLPPCPPRRPEEGRRSRAVPPVADDADPAQYTVTQGVPKSFLQAGRGSADLPPPAAWG